MSYSTRSRLREAKEQVAREDAQREIENTAPSRVITDSGVAMSAPVVRSPSTATRQGSVNVEVPEIPLVAVEGRILDHTAAQDDTSAPTVKTVRAAGRAPSIASTRSSRAQREAARRRIEYETEVEMSKARQKAKEAEEIQRLVEKKKAMQLAELEAEEEAEEEQVAVHQGNEQDRVGKWLEQSPFLEAETPRAPVDSQQRREASRERRLPGKAIEELATTLRDLARPRPTPRAFYELPTFTGDPAEWIFFKKKYDESTFTYDFRPAENMTRLQTALQGKARQLVEDLLRASSDPQEVIDTLERTYGDPNALLASALKKISALPKVSDDDRYNLRVFSATVRACAAMLKNIQAEAYINNPHLMDELLEKLTPWQRAQYGLYARERVQQSGMKLRICPTLKVFAEFLDSLADSACYSNPLNKQRSKITLTPSGKALSGSTRPPRVVHKVMEMCEKDSVNSSVNNSGVNSGDTNIVNSRSVSIVDKRNSDSVVKCPQCDKDHKLSVCDQFRKMDIEQRWDFVKKNRLCFKCLVGKHGRLSCRAKKCPKCNYGHHILLHVDNMKKGHKEDSSSSEEQPERVTNLGDVRVTSLLKVIPVTVEDGDVEHSTYALLDDGATVSLIDNRVAKNLHGPRSPLHLTSAGGHSVTDGASRYVKVKLRGPNGESHTINMRTVKDIHLPAQTVSKELVKRNKHLRELKNVSMEDAVPLLLIGQDNWELIVGGETKKGRSGQPVASLTRLGWVLHGPISKQKGNAAYVNNVVGLDELVKQQFELDNIGITQTKRVNREDVRAEKILESTARHTDAGWEIGLLWKRDNVELPDNRTDALKRLRGVEKKMDRDPAYAGAYNAQVERLLERGYARKVEGPIHAEPLWYLPHFGVTNPNKPGKLRLVFDAAASYKGTSLNDNLLSGPDLLNSLLGVLYRFRSRPVAVTADIEDMFLRVKIAEKDRGAQLFLWRGRDRNKEPETYMMESMIFGAASSPTSAIYILNKNAERFKDKFPEAVAAIKDRHYMDDYIDSHEDEETALRMIQEISDIHREGNFHIRGWNSNSAKVRAELPNVVPESVSLNKLGGEIERTLGMYWRTTEDTLSFDVSFKRVKSEIADGSEIPTKREFLRVIMSLFDPLGLIQPLTIGAKIIMRDIWKSGIGWDDKLPEECNREWKMWLRNLEVLRDLQIPRWYSLKGTSLELHVFGDASEQAYAAVAYLRDEEGNVALVSAKARVTPMKVVSIPRLELQAAVLVCRLADTIIKEHQMEIKKRVMWTDSKTALQWIKSGPREYKPYVAHRLAEIDRKSSAEEWRWLPTHENPADEATRKGWTPTSSKWFTGPAFLHETEENWPQGIVEIFTPEAEAELRPAKICTVKEEAAPLVDITRFSTWRRAVGTVARIIAFIRRRKTNTAQAVSGEDVKRAGEVLIQQAQRASFAGELKSLKKGTQLPPTSRLRSLDPMLMDGLLRVRGRLVAAERPYEEKHPIILDGKEATAQLLVAHYHRLALHGNTETVVNLLREKYWIIGLRPTVKKIARICPMCTIRRSQPNPPKMGDLPPARMAHHRRAFTHCGIDYFGPMEVTIGRRREKRWGVVLTCMTSRAIHLELAASLSADSAIMALRRFIARRGQPEVIYSDRGTNFVGANRELQRTWKEMAATHMERSASRMGITWKFISPMSPHMGGCWERLVRSTKAALKTVLKDRAPREEVLLTVLAEAEAVINSRPLTHVSVDPADPVALTPNHLLLGTASNTTPLGVVSEKEMTTRKQWKIAQGLADNFWRRWLKEYLPTLQRRGKWTQQIQPLRTDDIVIIADYTLPRNMWPKGRIMKVYPGPDGQVRVADVKTAHGVLRRPATKLIVLPHKDEG